MTTLWFSLRRHLLLSVLGGLTVLWLATLAWTYVDTHHEIDEIFDAQLAQAAQQALEQYMHGGSRPRQDRQHHDDKGSDHEDDDDLARTEQSHIAHRYQQRIAFQIWSQDGRLLLRSPSAPDTPMAQDDGYSEVGFGSKHWRYYSEWSATGTVRVVVGQSHLFRDELIGKITTRLALPLLVGLPLSAVWIGLALTRGLASVSEVAEDIKARGPEQLDAVAPARAPEEIRPLVDSLNNFLSRLARARAGERRFTADAAHELRTPLAGLRTQAQVALRAEDETTRRHALEQVLTGTGRAAHLVDQLLTLARLDPTRPQTVPSPADLTAVAGEVCADLGAAALARDIGLALDAGEGAGPRVNCTDDWLRILVRNLVDNAIRHTSAGGAVRVAIETAPGQATLLVEDDGPGIPAAERQTVFERFRRLAGQEVEGSGLGLSIVARIAELAGATVALDDGAGGRGLAVRVRFPTTA